MKPIRALTPSPLLLCALLGVPAASWAVPVYPSLPAPVVAPAFEPQRQHCQPTVRAQLRTADGREVDFGRVRVPDQRAPDWLGAEGGAWPAQLAAALHGAGQDPLDAQTSDCRLADSQIGDAAHLNDPIEWSALWQAVDELLEARQQPAPQDEEGEPQAQDARERLRLGNDQAVRDGGQPGTRAGVTSAVPEPSTYLMLLGGLACLALRARRR